ncbi:hypothetical protein NIES4071_31540 [Calothrix sp. NIES-4071]|nr:hypothetical protein NIES4071_31540 [Calothrix sp. NIES-4071]BAZ57474.1 hypothetical protein NIES4105_31480 [Calothrix sp. NIES-4105]
MLGFTENRSSHKPLKLMYARLVVFFRLRLTQVGLSGRYQPEEILEEALLRLDRTLKMGKKIYHEEAWLRKTGFLHILEIQQNQGNVDINDINIDVNKTLFNSIHAPTIDNIRDKQLESQGNYKLLNEVILSLKASERELLMMRFTLSMSWSEIARSYASQGEDISIPTLRQRGCRAVRSLRKAYLQLIQLRPSDKLDT